VLYDKTPVSYNILNYVMTHWRWVTSFCGSNSSDTNSRGHLWTMTGPIPYAEYRIVPWSSVPSVLLQTVQTGQTKMWHGRVVGQTMYV